MRSGGKPSRSENFAGENVAWRDLALGPSRQAYAAALPPGHTPSRPTPVSSYTSLYDARMGPKISAALERLHVQGVLLDRAQEAFRKI